MGEFIDSEVQLSRQVPGVGKTPAVSPLGSIQIDVKPARMGLLGLNPVFPSTRYDQSDLAARLGYAGNADAEKIFANTGVETRYLSVAPESLPFPDGGPQHQLAHQAILALLLQAARGAMRTSRVEASQVGCLIVHASFGYRLPGLAAELVNALRLPVDVVKYDLTGAGCVGAMPLLSLADDYLKAHPDRRVLGLVGDVPSMGLGAGEPDDKGAIVVNALFGDAAAGMVLGAAGAEPGLPEILDVHYRQAYDTNEVVYTSAGKAGVFGAHVSRGMADHAVATFGPAIDELLARHRLTRDDIRHWIMHPGGPAILDKLQAAFGLTDAQLHPSRETLRLYGNTSGPSCMVVLDRLVNTAPPQKGDWGIIGAIGPGLTVGVALVQW